MFSAHQFMVVDGLAMGDAMGRADLLNLDDVYQLPNRPEAAYAAPDVRAADRLTQLHFASPDGRMTQAILLEDATDSYLLPLGPLHVRTPYRLVAKHPITASAATALTQSGFVGFGTPILMESGTVQTAESLQPGQALRGHDGAVHILQDVFLRTWANPDPSVFRQIAPGALANKETLLCHARQQILGHAPGTRLAIPGYDKATATAKNAILQSVQLIFAAPCSYIADGVALTSHLVPQAAPASVVGHSVHMGQGAAAISAIAPYGLVPANVPSNKSAPASDETVPNPRPATAAASAP